MTCALLDKPRAGSLKIIVKDTGAGLTAHQLSKIFGEGVQFDANKLQGGKGSGLGLFISQNIAKQHGGRLSVGSDGPGEGCEFTLELPLIEDESVSEKRKMSPRIGKPANMGDVDVDEGLLKILVVDDSVSTRKVLMSLLRANSHICSEAVDGVNALEIYSSWLHHSSMEDIVESLEDALTNANDDHRKFDMIILDYEMPRMNGPETARRLRELGCDSLLLGVTGNYLPEDVSHFLESGVDDVLVKPLSISQLMTAWRKFRVKSEQQ